MLFRIYAASEALGMSGALAEHKHDNEEYTTGGIMAALPRDSSIRSHAGRTGSIEMGTSHGR